MLRFFSRFQADFQFKSGWIEPLLVGGYAPFSPKSNYYRKRHDATHELQAFAKYFERDMILDFKYERVEESETSDSGRGTHYYTTWCCSGIAVKKP